MDDDTAKEPVTDAAPAPPDTAGAGTGGVPRLYTATMAVSETVIGLYLLYLAYTHIRELT